METLEAGDPQQIGPYSLIGKLGTVSAGKIFAGRSVDGRVVAVTVVQPEAAAAPDFRERFRAGVGAARAVSGDFIMPVVDADPDAPSPWSATAFVPGLPLRRAVDRYGQLSESALRRLVVGLAGALTRIHAAGLIHGEVGPDSVLLAADGPYIAAFGLAGTTEADGSPMDDILGLGATVLFAASGSEPEWEGASEDARTRIAELETVTSTLPSSLHEVIGGCLYPDPSTRPTAQQLIDYLNRQGQPVPTRNWLPSALTADIEALTAATPSSTVGGGVSRRSLLFGLAGGALLIGGVAATAVFSSSGSPATGGKPGGSTPPTSPSGVSPTPSSTGAPAPIVLDAPDAIKAWTISGGSAPRCLEASDKVVMVVTDKTTAFIDASTGKTALPALNTTSIFGSQNTSLMAYAAGVFYYLCDTPNADNMVAAVDGTTGNVKWATTMAQADPSGAAYIAHYVAVNGNTVYVCGTVNAHSSSTSDTTTGYIRAFDGATGKGLWRVEGTDINNVLVPLSGSYLLATSSTPHKAGQVQMIDAGKQGAHSWKIPIPNAAYYFDPGWPMTCYAAGMFFFAGGAGDTLFAVDAATGAEKWHQQFGAKNGDQVELGTPFASLDGATVYVPVGSDLASLSAADGTPKWVATLTGATEIGLSNMFNASLRTAGMSAQCSADAVFVTDGAKNLWAIDAATGKARWKYNDPGQPDVGFTWIVGGDRVFIASNLTLTAISVHGQ
ncbi:outer membrane protein assembly factor BamB family protein [Amycolatopsis sp. H20-H5]|uniref:outer membrane protein assembly factor BamB family protein n=1 Tax=Amycolatopsis sp. H20-H5 TaxID=3046309 RepID=UPI002DBF6526|nr:PQQ-binding-like beta-propeller repeat protein [Amycolatopsis sp. H20-H5]MEC3982770.1 PQQ-binding-like beta-propeller repeat protein [Amycolatopsis sp. H20-H5]